MIEDKLLIKLLQGKGIAYMLETLNDDQKASPKPYLHELQDIREEFSGVFDTPRGYLLPEHATTVFPCLTPTSQLI